MAGKVFLAVIENEIPMTKISPINTTNTVYHKIVYVLILLIFLIK